LSQDDAVLDAQIIPYLASLLPTAQDEVVERMGPYIDRGVLWHKRIQRLLSQVRAEHTGNIVALLEKLLLVDPTFGADHFVFHFLDSIAVNHPSAACRIMGLLCDRILESHIAAWTEAKCPAYFPLDRPLEALNSGTLDRALKAMVTASPKDFLDALLPWLKRAVAFSELDTRSPHAREIWFPRDNLSDGLSHYVYAGQRLLLEAIVEALVAAATQDRCAFLDAAAALEVLPHCTPQNLLALAYEKVASHFAGNALAFLGPGQE
jgi:hypothetical protein